MNKVRGMNLNMKKNKLYIKTNIIGFIIIGLLFTGIGTYAIVTFPSNEVLYDNKTSGLKSTNVQGVIDELYETCTALTPAEQIIKKVGLQIVTTGDGLYKDEYK